MITIEKGIPIPPKNPQKTRSSLWKIIESMEVWDSFFYKNRNSVCSTISRLRGEKIFTIRAVEWGVRAWRVL